MMKEQTLELYVHIPFCKKKCRYCDFLSFAGEEWTQETYTQALIREIQEELGMEIAVERPLLTVTHVYPDLTVQLTLFRAGIVQGTPQLLEHAAMAWVTPGEAAAYNLCPADAELLERLKSEGILSF